MGQINETTTLKRRPINCWSKPMFNSRKHFLTLACAGALLLGAGRHELKAQGAGAAGRGAAGCKPLETHRPNAEKQKPAFAGQTRTCSIRSNAAFDVTVLAKGLVHPWSVEPLPGGDLLVTERPGRLRVISAK